MLILVSDLHLADDPMRASFDVDAFLREVNSQIQHCPVDDQVTLVLLGDVFEFLKTARWLEVALRPWHPHSSELENFVTSIAQAIVAANEKFFGGLRGLQQSSELRICVLPGNHDGLLANESGAGARAVLRSALGLGGDVEPFPSTFSDSSHGVWAQHGHEFDEFNSPILKNPRFVPGDVVVIEIVAALPVLVAKELGLEPDAPALRFLHELDNVLPQDGRGLAGWLNFSVQQLEPADQAKFKVAIQKCLAQCIRKARAEARTYGRITWLMWFTLRAVEGFTKTAGFSLLKPRITGLQPLGSTELPAVYGSALSMARTQMRIPQETYIFVAGHTHFPLHRPMAVGAQRVMTYMNSGTWRRIYLCLNPKEKKHAFTSFSEESMLVIQRRNGAKPPKYDFRRQVRGH